MSVLSTLALLISAAVRPKLKAKLKPAPDRQARILELELEADLAAAWRETEGRDLVEALPKSERRRVGDLAFPAPAGAPLAYELCNCVPSRSDMWAHSRRV
jgi:hypothetical protein